MAIFNITINSKDFYAEKSNILVTECSDTITYDIYADNGDSIDILLSGNHIVEKYILNGVETSFSDSTTVVFNNSLQIIYSLENSGTSGLFDNCTLTITNTTTSNPNNVISFYHERLNDKEKCNI